MKKMLMLAVAVAMLCGFAMADVRVEDMTAEEKVAHAISLYRAGDVDGWRELLDEVKDDESLPLKRRAYAWRMSGRPLQERFEAVKALGVGIGVSHYESLLVSMAREAEGEEQVKLVDEIVNNAEDFTYPYYASGAFLGVLESLDRESEAPAVFMSALKNTRAVRPHITTAFRVLGAKEALDALISTFPDRRDRPNFVPSLGEDGKLVDEWSVVTFAMDMVEGNYDTLTYVERTDFRRRIDGNLGMADPVHRILKEAIRSAQEADRKAQELFGFEDGIKREMMTVDFRESPTFSVMRDMKPLLEPHPYFNG